MNYSSKEKNNNYVDFPAFNLNELSEEADVKKKAHLLMRIWTHISVVKTTKARKQLMRLSLLYREFSQPTPHRKRALKGT